MPYAVVVPGYSNVFKSWHEVERVAAIYPYAKYRKFDTLEACWEYVRRHTYKRVYTDITKYGDTFDSLYVQMQYFIRSSKVYYNFHTKKLGYIAIECNDENVHVTNRVGNIKAVMNEIYLNDELITSHLIAIWHGLRIIGDFVDVDVTVPDHSVFYALMTYKGQNKTINRVREYIERRPAKLSVTLKDFGGQYQE